MRRRIIPAPVLIVSVAPIKSTERNTRPLFNVALNSVPSTSIDRNSAAVAESANAPPEEPPSSRRPLVSTGLLAPAGRRHISHSTSPVPAENSIPI
jgi:hypothetical protein